MNDGLNDSLLAAATKGNVDECRKLISQNANINHVDLEGNSAAHLAAAGNHIECLRLLILNQIDLRMVNIEGNTALHIAANKGYKEIALLLLISGSDYLIKNKEDEKPGDNNPDMKLFISLLAAENKAFNVLNADQKKKLRQIFDDVDKDKQKCIDIYKCRDFNIYTENVDPETAEKDAKDFISSCAICNKNTVNFEEWLFAFSKLAFCEPKALEKFFNDYDKTASEKGPFKDQKF